MRLPLVLLVAKQNIKGFWRQNSPHQTDSQNRDTTAPSGRNLYHLHFTHQGFSPENFGYTLVVLFTLTLKNFSLLYKNIALIFSRCFWVH